MWVDMCVFFFFQAEDGIRDDLVTGVQTCALPIYCERHRVTASIAQLLRSKKRGKCWDTFRFSTGVMRCAGAAVTLPRLGMIRTHEPTRKLARRLENGTARVLSATVSRTAGRWFVSFQVEGQPAVPAQQARACAGGQRPSGFLA